MKYLCFYLAVFAIAINAVAETARPEKPNIVLVLVDDLGWQDVKCYDIDEPCPMETPNIDSLATKGVMFWQAYSPSPVCSPSRAAILSGLHPVRGDMTHVAGGKPPHAWNPNAAVISPYFSARMPVERYTLAEALKDEGYVTAHSGKWHVANNHFEYPNAFHHGFDYSTHDRGVQGSMKPDRLTGFATRDAKDPYRLDENGYPFDVPQHAAMEFIRTNSDKPFFLYYATWLVHGPWLMRSEELLRKYEKKLGVKITEEHRQKWNIPGQKNPFYCAMVDQLDYYLGRLFDYLESAEDPRWPGHTLSENTYVILTSDNGGAEAEHMVTDNYPLDRGKISLREGGTRVPLIITGPGVPAGVQTDVMVNGLDFYPTILSLVGAKKPKGKIFDGCDLAPLLTRDPQDASLVRDASGKVRDAMMWHFPQAENTSSIRRGDYKLLRSYTGLSSKLALYRLYNSESGKSIRGDIEEMKDISAEMPALTAELNARLSEMVDEMGGRIPYGNPATRHAIPNKEKVPTVTGHAKNGNTLVANYRNNGADVVFADLIYTPNEGREWLRVPGWVAGDNTAVFEIPKGTTHYFINLVDENNFLVIDPPIDRAALDKNKPNFTEAAHFAGYPEMEQGTPVDFSSRYKSLSRPGEGAAVLVSENLENPNAVTAKTSDAGVAVTDAHAASGSRSLMLAEEGFAHAWMPLVGYDCKVPPGRLNGSFTLGFDVLLDAEAPGRLSLMFRNQYSGKVRVDGGSAVIGNGALRSDDILVSAVEPGAWYHLEFVYGANRGNGKFYEVSIAAADGRTASSVIPYPNHAFNLPDWIGFAAVGEDGSKVYIDNIVVRVDGSR